MHFSCIHQISCHLKYSADIIGYQYDDTTVKQSKSKYKTRYYLISSTPMSDSIALLVTKL